MIEPWDTPEVAEGLHSGWTCDPVNVADVERLVAAALAEVPRPYGVLDYGCGTGRLARYFPSVKARSWREAYMGYDTSPAMLAIARREHPDHDFVANLPIGRRFDLVICNSVVQYQPPDRWDAVLRDMVTRARKAALIEVCDVEHELGCRGGPLPEQRAGGGDAPIWIWPSCAYHRVLSEFGAVERRVLAPDPRGALALYVVRR